MPVHRHLDDEINILRSLLLRMTDLVDEQFADALNALLSCDTELAQQVRRRDDEVDALELQIDRQCERILALHQPVAEDLRMLIIAVKINTDLERIGDHAKNIAKNTPHVKHAPGALSVTCLDEMADSARHMLREVQDAFQQRDRLKAREVVAQDQQIDRLHLQNFKALVAFGQQHPDQVEAVAHLITASKALERISDHAKNIAESVVFLIEAVDIRHRKLQWAELDTNPGTEGGR